MVKIEIVKDIKKRMAESDAYVRNVLAGKKKIRPVERTVIMTPKVFAKIFSPQRISLMLELREANAGNIYQLAKKLGRSYEAVHRDVKLLEGFGIIKIRIENRKSYPQLVQVSIPAFAEA